MNWARAILIFFCFSILAIIPIDAQEKPARLPEAEARRIAEAFASRRPNFDQFQIICSLGQPDYWNFLYVRKGTRTVDAFSIRVSNKTKTATFVEE